MLFSGKENIFKCLVAFQKMLWKIFSGVWLYCWKCYFPTNFSHGNSTHGSKLRQLKATTTKTPPPHHHNNNKNQNHTEREVGGSKARSKVRSLRCDRRTGAREIDRRGTIGEVLRSTQLVSVIVKLELGVRLFSLSLSLSVRNSFEVKIGTEIHFCGQSVFFSVNWNWFPKNSIFRINQTPAFPEKHFRKWFSPKTNTPLSAWFYIYSGRKLILGVRGVVLLLVVCGSFNL